MFFLTGRFGIIIENALSLDIREDMGRKCIEIAKKYDWDRTVDLTESIYEELLK